MKLTIYHQLMKIKIKITNISIQVIVKAINISDTSRI
jgi:hypothetical protein